MAYDVVPRGRFRRVGPPPHASRVGEPAICGSLADVAVRSVVLSGAGVRALRPDADGAPAYGIGALCRSV